MTNTEYEMFKARGADNIPKCAAAVALGRLSRGHKKTLTNAQREAKRQLARALTPARLAKRAKEASREA